MLFEVKKYQPAEQPAAAAAGVVDEQYQIAPYSDKLRDVIQLVDYGKTVHWMSAGDWSMHQLLDALLMKIELPTDVWISTYAFSEKPARMIADYKRTLIIKSLKCIIDSRVDVRSASALNIVRNAADKIKLCDTHAKVTVLKNEKWFLAVSGSANYTTNKRYEAGIITADPAIALFHQKWIEDELRKTI